MNDESDLPCITSLKGVKLTPKFVARFESKIQKNGPVPPHCPEIGECWEWTGLRLRFTRNDSPVKLTYGRIMADSPIRKTLYAHRVAYELYVGTIPDGMLVLHKCDNTKCVRGDHLFIGTNLDNIADKVSKGRSASGDRITKSKKEIIRGSQIGTSKATESMVVAIRKEFANGSLRSYLASKYGLGWSTINKMIRRETWNHV